MGSLAPGGMDARTLSKILSEIENGGPRSIGVLKKLYAQCRGAPILGITGLPGAGKSTLVDQLIQLLRAQRKTVGVIAVDPSSPFTGGALLGDRVRMQRHATDDGVFIRSIGSRGAHGGVSRATRELALCFDAAGFDQILIETVGVGQTELDIMGIATTTVVVLMPEAGDTIQTIKAGLMEIGDIFVVNKSDREGALGMQTMVKAMLTMALKKPAWPPPVLMTQAQKGEGVAELLETVEKHRRHLQTSPNRARRQKTFRREQFFEICWEAYRSRLLQKFSKEAKFKKLIDRVADNQLNPYEALEAILKEF